MIHSSAGCLRRRGRQPSRSASPGSRAAERPPARPSSRRLRPAVQERGRVVAHDLPGAVHPGAQVDHVRGAELIPAGLVPAHQLHADGLADAVRHERGGRVGVVVLRVPVAAGGGEDLHADVVRGREVRGVDLPERVEDERARAVRCLRRAEHDAGVLDVGHGRVRAHGGVCLVRDRVAAADHRRGGVEARADVAARRGHGVVQPVRGIAHRLEEVAAARQRGRVVPLHLELGRRLDRGVLERRDHAEEVAVAHDLDVGEALD